MKVIPEYVCYDDKLYEYATEHGVAPVKAYRILNCAEHYNRTGERLDSNSERIFIGEPVQIKTRTNRPVVTSGEGLSSTGSDYWLHKDVLEDDR